MIKIKWVKLIIKNSIHTFDIDGSNLSTPNVTKADCK